MVVVSATNTEQNDAAVDAFNRGITNLSLGQTSYGKSVLQRFEVYEWTAQRFPDQNGSPNGSPIPTNTLGFHSDVFAHLKDGVLVDNVFLMRDHPDGATRERAGAILHEIYHQSSSIDVASRSDVQSSTFSGLTKEQRDIARAFIEEKMIRDVTGAIDGLIKELTVSTDASVDWMLNNVNSPYASKFDAQTRAAVESFFDSGQYQSPGFTYNKVPYEVIDGKAYKIVVDPDTLPRYVDDVNDWAADDEDDDGNPCDPSENNAGLCTSLGGSTAVDSGSVSSKPVIIDMDKDGVETTFGKSIAFDVDGDGFLEQTNWVAPDDGFLVFDDNSDNKVLDIKEIAFGQWTAADDTDLLALATARDAAGNRTFDTNGDGKLSATDSTWLKFKIWQDADQDGIVDSGEMKTLQQLGFQEIQLSYADGSAFTEHNDDVLAFGNTLYGVAEYTRNGVAFTGVGDVALSYNDNGWRRIDIKDSSGVVIGYEYQFESGEKLRYSNVGGLASKDLDLTANVLDGATGDARANELTASGFSRAVQVSGGEGNDTIRGGGNDDMLSGDGGADSIDGNDGNDVLFIDQADLTSGSVFGGRGLDTAVVAGVEGVTLTLSGRMLEGAVGGVGNDTLTGTGIDDDLSIRGGDGDDGVTGGDGDDDLNGDAGNDTVIGGVGDDQVFGGDGLDSLFGGTGSDFLMGGTLADTITASSGDDEVFGGTGADSITGGYDDDLLYGGEGADIIFGGYGDDVVTGGTGADVLSFWRGDDTLMGEGGDDVFRLENLGEYGTYKHFGWAVLQGGKGSDTVVLAGARTEWSVEYLGGNQWQLYRAISGSEKIVVDVQDIERLQFATGTDWVLGSFTTADTSDNYIRHSVNPYVGDSAVVTTGGLFFENGQVNGWMGNDSIGTLAILGGDGGGFNGANVIDGGGGTDTVNGGAGNDTIVGDEGADILNGGADNDSISGGSGSDRIYGGDGLDTITGLAGSDAMWAGAGNDSLNGGDGSDVIVGDAGNDTAIGGSGADQISGGTENDVLSGENGFDRLYGDAGNDTLTGGAGSDYLYGGDGADTLIGDDADATNDSLAGGGFNMLSGGAGNDSLLGGIVDDQLAGGEGNDTLAGGYGRDALLGGAGADVLYGGIGLLDLASYEGSTARVLIDLSDNSASGGDAQGDILSSIEQVIGSDFDDNLAGGLTDNTLAGGKGDDFVSGREGNDNLTGGAGDDVLYGGDGLDRLWGDAGSDLFYGGADSDTMYGGTGIDIITFATAGTGLIVDLYYNTRNEGAAAGSMYVGIESIIGSDNADVISGYGAANIFVGGLGNDTLRGRGGADALYGGSGWDAADYSDAAVTSGTTIGVRVDLLVESWNTGVAAGDTFTSIERINGSAFDDQLRGSDGGNTLYGLAGDDILTGRGDGDGLYGGDGLDTAGYGTATAAVQVDLLDVTLNTGEAAGDTFSSIENLSGSIFSDNLRGDNAGNALSGEDGNDLLYGRDGNDALTGDAGADKLYGSNGNDWLHGSAGADSLYGGADSDRVSYRYATGGILADLETFATANTGEAAGDVYDSIENLAGSIYNDNLRGDALANDIAGNDGNDILYGRAGNDTLDGSAGADILFGQAGNDILTGGADADEFRFALGYGQDRVADFENNIDEIVLTGLAGVTTATLALTKATQVGANVQFDFGGGDTLLVLNVTKAQLTDDLVIG
jgi:Ca2+-binding RTX toxin-like protein